MSIRVAIVGPTGYTGLFLMELLLRHPSAKVTYLASRRDHPPNICNEFPQLLGRISDNVTDCRPIDAAAIARDADVVFTCLPNNAAMKAVPALLDAGLHVIDLSGDYRLDTGDAYEQAYHHKHTDAANLAKATYGLPELFRDSLRGETFISNPGCYPTPAAISLAPLLTQKLINPSGIIINGASGVTGGGRNVKPATHFPELNESFTAYNTIGGHQHQPEIVQTLSRVANDEVDALFVPHLLPIDRGILLTIYADPARDGVSQENLFAALENAYDDEPFVRVRNDLPNVKQVRDTNFCDVTARLITTTASPKVVVFSAEDNMIKGAAGQAIQNMNLMFDQEETAGLI